MLPAPVVLAPVAAPPRVEAADDRAVGTDAPAATAAQVTVPATGRSEARRAEQAPPAPRPAMAQKPALPHAGRVRSLAWLLLLALGAVLLAWWASMRRGQQLRLETERLARQQRYLKTAHAHLQEKSQKLQHLSMHDPLTGTLNRQAFAAELRERIDHLAKYGQPLSLIVFDLDHFKQINDRNGHLVGDAALKLVAGVVREHLVSDDLFGRFGGDEFMIACAGHTAQHTATLADALRDAVAKRAKQAQPPIPGLTLSLGVAQADPDSGYLPDELFERADTALYRAKQRGRNCVAIADADATPAQGAIRRHL